LVLWFARLKVARFHDCGYVCRMGGEGPSVTVEGHGFHPGRGDLVRFRSALVVFVVRVQKADNQAFS